MLPQGVLAAILILGVTFDRNRSATSNTKCISPANANLSCNFTSDGDTCGWKVVNNENVTRNWTFDGEGQLTVEMNKTDPANTSARLISNLTCDTNSQYFLRFVYSNSIKPKDNDSCELMVFCTSNGTLDPIWMNRSSSKDLVSSEDIRIEVQNEFRLIIQAKKITNKGETCTLKLDNIVFRSAASPTAVLATPTSVTTSSETLQTIQTTLTPSGSATTVEKTEAATSTDTTKTHTTTPVTTTSPATASTSAATDLPHEAFVGIVLGIVAIISVAIATFLLLRKKTGKETKCCTHYLMHFGKSKQHNTSGGGPTAMQPETNTADGPSQLSQTTAPGGNGRVSRLPSNLPRGNPAEDNCDYLTPTSESVVSPAASHNYHDTAPEKVYHHSTAADKGYYNVAPPAAAHDIGGKANYSNVRSPTTKTDTDNHAMSHIKDGRVSVSTDDHVSYYNTPDADGYYNATPARNVITAGQENHYTKLSPVNPDTQDSVYTGLTPETDNATSEESYEKPSLVKPDEHLYTGLR